MPSVKTGIKEKLLEQVWVLIIFFWSLSMFTGISTFQTEDLLETAMTYTLFEFAKENEDYLLREQPSAPVAVSA